MNRRDAMWGLSGITLAGAGTIGQVVADATLPDSPAAARPGMRHRSYSGKILYLSDGIGEQGREFFSVTVQPDGSRTLRAQVEMDNDRLLRDVVLTVDRDFHPIDAFVRPTASLYGRCMAGALFIGYTSSLVHLTIRRKHLRHTAKAPT